MSEMERQTNALVNASETDSLNTELWAFCFTLVLSLTMKILANLSLLTGTDNELDDQLDCGQLGDQVDIFNGEEIAEYIQNNDHNNVFSQLIDGHDHHPPIFELLTFDNFNGVGYNAPPVWRDYNKECFWDCTWKPNPYHKKRILFTDINFPDSKGEYTEQGEPIIDDYVLYLLSTSNFNNGNIYNGNQVFSHKFSELLYSWASQNNCSILVPLSAPENVICDFIKFYSSLPETVKIDNIQFELPLIPEDVHCLSDCLSFKSCKYGGFNPNILNNPDWIMKYPASSAKRMFEFCLHHNPPYLLGEYDIVMESCLAHWKDQTGDCFNSINNKKNHNRKRIKKKSKNATNNRLIGNGVQKFILSTMFKTEHQYPWACSVRTFGYRGRHMCGATLLSAPPNQTIIVTTAHCNYLCKESNGNVVENCCCRGDADPGSCKNTSSYCGTNPNVKKASNTDIQIVCGEFYIGLTPEDDSLYSRETEVVLNIEEIINHPKFIINDDIQGYDIAVYKLTIKAKETLANNLKRGKIWPACLPNHNEMIDGDIGRFAAWKDPIPTTKILSNEHINQESISTYFNPYTAGSFASKDSFLHHTTLEYKKCQDPNWMNSTSYYPKGSFCATDPSQNTCFDTGDSGSGIIMERQDSVKGVQWTWEGSLSAYRGCDQYVQFPRKSPNQFNYWNTGAHGANPGIFSQGKCYLGWIAEQYGMKLLARYNNIVCQEEVNPDMKNKDETDCLAQDIRGTPDTGGVGITNCDFTTNQTQLDNPDNFIGNFAQLSSGQCSLRALEGYVQMVNQCPIRISNSQKALGYSIGVGICANNCKGVKASSIVVGGSFVMAALAFSSSQLAPVVAGGLGVAGIGGLILSRGTCLGPLFCQRGIQCCMVVFAGPNVGYFCPPVC